MVANSVNEGVVVGRRMTIRVAGIAALLGGLVAIGVNILHPRPPEHTDELLTLVATLPHWAIIHYIAALATPLIVSGLALLVRTLQQGVARAVGEVGAYMAALGGAAFMVAIVIDGYGYPRFASLWMAAAGDEKAVVLWAARALHTADAALFPVWAGLFLGLGIVLVAAALWRSGEYSRPFAAAGVIGGTMCFAYAMSVVAQITMPLPLWPLGPGIVGLWIATLGVILLRRSVN